MPNKKNLSSRFAVPGEKLGVIEEYLVGKGTYENNGIIHSSHVGYARMDTIEKTVMITPSTKNPIIPNEGDEVLGVVVNVQDRQAIIEIFMINNSVIPLPFSTVLHISNSSPKYENKMNEVCKRGDFIKAKVINVKNRLPKLTTVGIKLGIVKASCSKCGETLVLKGKNLVCSTCGNHEWRKISQEYNKLEEIKR